MGAIICCSVSNKSPLLYNSRKTYTILPSSHWLLQTGLLIFFNFLSSEYLRLTWRIVFAKRATEGWKCSDSWKETCEIRSTPAKTAGYLRKSPKLKLKRIHKKSDSQNLVSGNFVYLKIKDLKSFCDLSGTYLLILTLLEITTEKNSFKINKPITY